jgi:glycosyltransferase involved in cell wall biosynthesis
VHDEARIVETCLARMLDDFRTLGAPFDIVVCENGSADDTLRRVEAFGRAHPEVKVQTLPEANYGLAIKQGVAAATHEVVAVVNIDFWDLDFMRSAMALVETHDLVVGSKAMQASRDERPPLRRLITRGFNTFLRHAFGFRGTDTHGVKMFRRSALLPIVRRCVTDQWILDSEIVLRAERAGLSIVEVPVRVREMRAPGYRALVRRVPTTVWNLLKLRGALAAPERPAARRR